MAREDLVSSAVTFLQDPSVAASPLQKRIEFLQSKNLTQEEIDLAIARSSDESSYQSGQTASYSPQNQSSYPSPSQQYNRGPLQRLPPYASGPYGPYGEWQPPPPPEPPRRDWRDWFIMATVTSGAAYGLYVLTKRYIAPLISPPTPPQLEADKSAIDEQFSRAFALIDTLSADTATLKSAEEARTERLDKALEEVEAVVSDLRTSARRREEETRRLNDELRGLKEGIPKALEGHRESGDKRLKELAVELKSLKALIGNRFGGPGSSQPQHSSLAPSSSSAPQPNGLTSPGPEAPTANGNTTPSAPPTYQVPASSSSSSSSTTTTPAPPSWSAPSQPPPQRQSFPSTTGAGPAKASIPAWQMAAAANRRGATTPSSAAAAAASRSGEGGAETS